MKRKRVKCRHCKKGFLVEPGKFPKKLFEHIGKMHPNAQRKNRKVQASERLPRKGKVHRGRKREVHVTEQALESGDVTIIIRRS